MTTWFVLIVALVLSIWFVCLPVRMDARYDGDVFSIVGRVGPVPFRLLPKKKAQTKAKKPFSKPLIKNGIETLYKAIEVMKVELLRIHFTAAGPDPYDAAMAYARMGVTLEALEHFSVGRVERTDLRADVDFEGGQTVLDSRILLRARMFHVLRFGTGFLRGYFQHSPNKTEG